MSDSSIVSSGTTVNGFNYTVSSDYESLRRKSIVYPNGRRVDLTWCNNGLLDIVRENGTTGNIYIADYEYIAIGGHHTDIIYILTR
jgi:hypothetical protein